LDRFTLPLRPLSYLLALYGLREAWGWIRDRVWHRQDCQAVAEQAAGSTAGMGRLSRYYPGLILLAGILAYANIFQGAFVLDDNKVIVQSRHIRTLGVPLDWLHSRGLTDLTFACNYAVGGLNPVDYHAVNLLIHLLSALVLFGLVRRALQRPEVPAGWRDAASGLAAAVAALWVAHPLTTGAVTYTCQRYEALMGLFYLVTLYAAHRAFSAERRTAWPAVAVCACVLGMWSKEIMFTAPVVVALYDRCFFSESWGGLWRRRGLTSGLEVGPRRGGGSRRKGSAEPVVPGRGGSGSNLD
jgi:hypothetical protein